MFKPLSQNGAWGAGGTEAGGQGRSVAGGYPERELFGNCKNINIDNSSAFAAYICCSSSRGTHREG